MYTQPLDLDSSRRAGRRRSTGLRTYAEREAGPGRAERALGEAPWRWRPVAFHAMHPGWADTPGVRASLPRFHSIMRPVAAHAGRGRRHGRVARERRTGGREQRPILARPPAASRRTLAWHSHQRRRRGAVLGLVRRARRRSTFLSERCDEDRDRRHRRVGARRGAPAAPGPRHHRVREPTRGSAATPTPSTSRSTVGTHAVDTGFIVYNERNYPGFVALLDELGVATQPTEMSFGVSDPRTGLEFRGSNLNSLFAQRRNLARPVVPPAAHRDRPVQPGRAPTRRRRAALERTRPARATGGDRRRARDEESLAEFVRRGRLLGLRSCEQFLVPFGASIWSADPATFMQFPVRAYARFMHNHGLLEVTGRPQWRTITGGSRQLRRRARRAVRRSHPSSTPPCTRSSPHESHDRSPSVEILTGHGPERSTGWSSRRTAIRRCACSATRPTAERSRSSARSGTSATPRRCTPTSACSRATSGRERAGTTAVDAERTPGDRDVLDEPAAVDRDCPAAARHAEPRDAIDAAQRLPSSSTTIRSSTAPRWRRSAGATRSRGARGIFFAGAYWGYGFHEDGVQSALEVVRPCSSRTDPHGRCLRRHRPSSPVRADVRASSRRSCSSPTSTSTRCPDSLDRLPLWSARRGAPVRFRRARLLRRQRPAARRAVRDLVKSGSDGDPRAGSICSPTSAPSGGCSIRSPSTTAGRRRRALDAVVLEVTNTPWGERHWYVLDARDGRRPPRRPRRCTSRRSCRWTSTTGSPGPSPGAELHLGIEVDATTRPSSPPTSPCADGPLDRRRAADGPGSLPAAAAAVSRRDLPRSRATLRPRACRSTGIPITGGAHERKQPRARRPSARARPCPVDARARRPTGASTSAAQRLDSDARRSASRARPAGVRARAPTGQRRARRVVRRRLVGHRRPHRLPAARAPRPRAHPSRPRPRCTAGCDPVVDPIARHDGVPTRSGTARNVRAHYDLGNELFQRMLDDTMMYSCAVFESPDDSLADSVRAQARPARRLLELAPGDRVLEIGTGWGGFAMHAATQLRLPRHDDDDLAPSSTSSHGARVTRRRARRSHHGARRRLPRPRRHLRQGRSRSR